MVYNTVLTAEKRGPQIAGALIAGVYCTTIKQKIKKIYVWAVLNMEGLGIKYSKPLQSVPPQSADPASLQLVLCYTPFSPIYYLQ